MGVVEGDEVGGLGADGEGVPEVGDGVEGREVRRGGSVEERRDVGGGVEERNVADVAGIEGIAVLARASGPLGSRNLGDASKREARTRGAARADANRRGGREVAPEREGAARRFS